MFVLTLGHLHVEACVHLLSESMLRSLALTSIPGLLVNAKEIEALHFLCLELLLPLLAFRITIESYTGKDGFRTVATYLLIFRTASSSFLFYQ